MDGEHSRNNEIKSRVLDVPTNTIVGYDSKFYRVDQKQGEKTLQPVVAVKDSKGKVEFQEALCYGGSHQQLVFDGTGFVVESDEAANGGYMSFLKNGELINQAVEKVEVGDELVLRNGKIVSIVDNGDGTVSLVKPDGKLSAEEQEMIKDSLETVNGAELADYVQSKLKEMGREEVLRKASRFFKDGKLNLSDFRGAYNIGLKLTSFNYLGLDRFGAEDKLVANCVLEYIYEKLPEEVGLLERQVKSQYYDKARRLDYEAQRYQSYQKLSQLPEEMAALPEAVAKAADLWNRLLGSERQDQDLVVEEHLGKLPEESRQRIVRLSGKLAERKYDDPELAELMRRYEDISLKLSVSPPDSKIYRNYLEALLIEDEYTKEAFPFVGECIEDHQKRMNLFWDTAFDRLGIDRPEWFGDYTYKSEEVNYFFRANGVHEFHGGNPNTLFIEGYYTLEDVTGIFDHEATHEIFGFSKGSKRYRKPNDCAPSNFHHEETVVELMRQLYGSMRVEDGTIFLILPSEDAILTSYQSGVAELVRIMKSSGKDDETMIGQLVQGTVDYLNGEIGDPVQMIREVYEKTSGRDDFYQRIDPFSEMKALQRKREKVVSGVKSEDIPKDLQDRFWSGVLWMN